MKGAKTPPPSAKGDKKRNQTASAGAEPNDQCSIVCAVQPKSDDPTVDRCMVPSSLIKRLEVNRIGSYVVVTFPNGSVGLFNIWPHSKSKTSSDAATFHRVWGPNFESIRDAPSPGTSKFVQISSKRMATVRVVPCSKLVCCVFDARNRLSEIMKSANFRSILKGYLENVHLQSGIKLSFTFQGGQVTVMIHRLFAEVEFRNGDSSEENLVFYKVLGVTDIVIVDESDDFVTDLITNDQTEYAAASYSSSHLTAPVSSVTNSVLKGRIGKLFAGYETEVDSLIELVLSGLSFQNSVTRPKGVIVCGPPGTGKSQLVQATVQSLGCNVKYLDHSLLLRALEGEAETILRQCFDEASRIPPCCIIMENMELLLPSRAASTTTYLQKRITSCWLSILDSLAQGVIVLGLTTRANDLDAAVRRAGRMEREIEIGVPSPSDRYAILAHLLKRAGAHVILQTETSSSQYNDAPDLHFATIQVTLVEQIAAAAHGTVGADLLTLVKEIFYQNLSSSVTKSTDDLQNSFCSLSMSTSKTGNTFRTPISISDSAARNALRKISPSALREVVVEVPTVNWTDIGGMQPVKEALQQVVEWPLKHSDWYASLHIGPLKGVLLYGPPGCSKTLMAKAIATESSMNFLAVRGPELLSKWLGESEKAVQALFRRARAAAPAIVFFDEIDALAGVRGEMSSGVSDRVLAQLLTELDGIESLKQVVVIAATNRPDMLDPALIRPGRIDRKIYVPPPDEGSRRSILSIELKKMPTATIVTSVEEVADEHMIWIDELVELTEGFSGAEVVALCSEAALLAVEEEAELLTRKHLVSAASKIKPQITAEMLQFYDKFRQSHR